MLRSLCRMEQYVRALDRRRCLTLLGENSIGRLAVTHRALPAIVPVNYVLLGSSVVFRTEPGGMLSHACRDAVVGFEVDDLSIDGCCGESVLVVGPATVLTGSAALRAIEAGLITAAGPGRDEFIGVSIGQLTGREVATGVPTGCAS